MLVFMDSFDHYATADLGMKWTTNSGTIGSSSPSPRTGVNRYAGHAAGLQKTNPNGSWASGVACFGYQFNTTPAAAHTFFSVRDSSTTHLSFVLNGSGTISVYRGTSGGTLLGTSASALSNVTWYHVRLKWTIHDSTGTVEVYVNGTKTGWIDLAGQDTRNAGNATWDNILVLSSGGGTTSYFDDFILLDSDTSDGANDLTDIEGTPIVGCVRPSTGDGTRADFTPSTGTDNGAMVDEAAPDGDTTHNESDTAGHIDTYNFPALGVTGTIHGIQVTNTARKTDAGTRTIAAAAYIGSTDYAGANANIDTAYAMYPQVWAENPATASPWQVSEIDAAEFGVKLVA